MRDLLTNADLYSYDPAQVLNQLTFNASRSNTPSSLIDITKLNKIPTNKQKVDALLESLNPYTLTYKLKLSRVKKSMNLMIANTILVQDSTKLLFKVNLTREARKKKAKDDLREGMRYRPAFDRVLIETKAKKHRDEEIKNLKDAIQKKKASEAKKTVAIIKKEEIEVIRQIKRKMMTEKRGSR